MVGAMTIHTMNLTHSAPMVVMLALLLSCGNRVEMSTEQDHGDLDRSHSPINSPRPCPIHGAVGAPACVYSFEELVKSKHLTTAVMVGGWLGEKEGKKVLFGSRSDMDLSSAASIELSGLERTPYKGHPNLFLGRLVRIVGFMHEKEGCADWRLCRRVLEVKAVDYVVDEDFQDNWDVDEGDVAN